MVKTGAYLIKTDSTQPAIVAALKAAGATVELIQSATGREGIPDLLVGFRGRNTLIEVKRSVGKRKPRPADLSDGQVKWHAKWEGEKPHVCMTPLQALLAIGLSPSIAEAHMAVGLVTG